MDFELTAEQRLIVETVSDLVRNELYPHETEVERLDEVPAEVSYRFLAGGGLPGYRKMLDSEDAREGARAFSERRDPVWRGR